MKDWFLSELKAMSAPSDLARYALDMSNQRVALIERTLNGPRIRDEADYGAADFADRIEAVRRRVARRRGAEAPVDLLLPQSLTLHRIETFPAEARRQLREDVWWRLDQLTPYAPEELCFDVAVVGVEPKTGFLDVSIAAAPRDIVEEALAHARAWGFTPQRVSASAALDGFPHGPLFLEVASAEREALSLKRAVAALAATAVVLAALGTGRAVMARVEAAETLEARAAEADARLATALEVRARTLDLAARAAHPAARRAAERPTAQWLAELAEAAPPDLAIERLSFINGRVRIEGAAGNAEAALAALDGLEAFVDARYAAPVRPALGAAVERFAIEALLAPPSPKDAAASGDGR